MAKRVRRIPTGRKRRTSSEELKEIREKMETVKCAFCDGTGKDPFEFLSKLSACQVCLGKGEVEIEGPTTRCKFCKGTGIQPYSENRLHCIACGGKGVVTVIEPSKECPTCHGTGTYPRRPQPLPCPACKGQGIVSPERG